MKILKSVLFIIVLVIFTEGCSSSSETVKSEDRKVVTAKKEAPKETVPANKAAMNADEMERALIVEDNISTIDKIIFEYNDQGKLVPKGKFSTTSFNDNGYAIETISYDDKGKQEYKFTSTYDEDNKIIETIRYNRRGKADSKYTYEYDKNGNKTKASRFDMAGKLEKYYTYQYDGDDNLIRETWFDDNGTTEFKIEYKYDDLKRKIESRGYDKKGNLAVKYIFNYDAKGNITEEVKFNSQNKAAGVLQYVYKK